MKAPQGAGHLWTISSADSEENILAWEHVSFYENILKHFYNLTFSEETKIGVVL